VKSAAGMQESPSTTGATYVEPSGSRCLSSGEKIDHFFRRNMEDEFIVQRLTDRTWFLAARHYTTIFKVTDHGVILFDAPADLYSTIVKAIETVTDQAITVIVYSHSHADHIGDAPLFLDAAAARGVKMRIVASAKTADKMRAVKSALPSPTDILAWPRAALPLEGGDTRLELHGFEWAAHTEDHSAWLLVEDRVIHSPDLISPDRPPFYRWGGNERFAFHEENLRQVYELNWDHICGGHGNVGSHDDIDFQLRFSADLKAAVMTSVRRHPFTEFLDPEAGNHAAFFVKFLATVAAEATDELRPQYGSLYGFEDSTPANAEMVALYLHGDR
jgi:glyoxylase-like metal-dependent hydrolase (beta-lactamase superfamily II)